MWPVLAGFCLAASPVAAFHTVFDYQLERVDMDGGAYGPADGTLDFVDEFDDGVLGSEWTVAMGTAHEADGVLHLTSPGQHIPYTGTFLDVSEVYSTTVLDPDGGDFTVTTTWRGGVREGDFVNLALYMSGGTAGGSEFFGTALFNIGGDMSFQQYWGEGYTLGEGTAQTVDLSPEQPFVLRLSFDDESNTATVSFSQDGGATWLSPFEPVAVFRGRIEGIIVVGADPVGTEIPNCCDGPFCLNKIDTDGDGTCDGLDKCSAVASPSNGDIDADGIGDECDICVPGPDSMQWNTVRMLTKKLRQPDQRLRLDALVELPDGATLDPVATGLRVQIPYRHYAPIDLEAPAGARTTGPAGWRIVKPGKAFVYSDGTPTPPGGLQVIVRRRPDGLVRVRVTPPRGPFRFVDLRVGVAFPGMQGGCAEHAFVQDACDTRGNVRDCRD